MPLGLVMSPGQPAQRREGGILAALVRGEGHEAVIVEHRGCVVSALSLSRTRVTMKRVTPTIPHSQPCWAHLPAGVWHVGSFAAPGCGLRGGSTWMGAGVATTWQSTPKVALVR